MDKLSVVLDRKNMDLTMDGKSLRIDIPGEKCQRIPLGMVGQVIVYGNPRVACNVWRKLAEYGIPSLLLPARGKGDGAWVTPGTSTSVNVRIAQFKAWADPGTRKKAAAWAVREKLNGVQEMARRLELTCPFVRSALEHLDKADSIDEIRGIEGNAAREWFGFMGGLLSPKWAFTERNRRPPKDPVNALLSLGYTLLFGEVHRGVMARGLDPGIGFLHSPYPGRHSLALDLMEPLRPGVDLFSLALTQNSLAPTDFTTGNTDGCRISKNARRMFYASWEEFKADWPIGGGGSSGEAGTDKDPPNLALTVRHLVNRFVRTWGIDDLDEPIIIDGVAK
ncbi:CRISPR-associated endonuclease Cas1 [Desulfobacter latus]|uniref:CRISPR-associated endonuclease Cas1 n=1 Tax=Desulfobacter latus TaxID=2292 RepID=A0A850T6L3_9BACT|nr:CRISPR-associated endonuclease Cas1 [Desulfobacter latus]NWH03867.1 CRISPR-associated endonuclease Cas1 [Desulfobacter latus]